MTVSYGDVTGEYLALRSGAGLVSAAHEIVWVEGGDTVSFLDGLLSQSIEDLAIGAGAPSLLLAPQGKLRATLWVLRGEDRVGLLCDAGRGAVVLGDLQRFKLRVDVTLTLGTEPVADLIGPAAARVLADAGVPAPDERGWVTAGDAVIASVPFAKSNLPRFVLVGADGDAFVDAGAVCAGSQASTAIRIEAGEPLMGVDIDDGTIPQEGAVVDGAVDFTKGCYLGQELVARIESRGRVNRHLRGVVVAENVIPPIGATVTVRGDEVGSVSSIAESLELRAPVGMAMLRREAEPGDTAEILWDGGSTTGTIAELPLLAG